jgi:chromosome segregation and condensation protein ScpB
MIKQIPSEQERRKTRASELILLGYTTERRINDLRDILKPKEGIQEVKKLIKEIRKQWRDRRK